MTAITPNLTTLAADANAAHRAAEQAARSMLNHARECGDVLLKAKDALEHGEFTAWIQANCEFSPQHARRYMTIARGWSQIMELSGHEDDDGKTIARERFLDTLSIREALRILSAGGNEQLFNEDGNHVGGISQLRCPGCQEFMGVTSKRYVTCVHCFDCRLYPLHAKEDSSPPVNHHERARRAVKHLDVGQRSGFAVWLVKWLDADGIAALTKGIEAHKQREAKAAKKAKREAALTN